MLIPVSSAVGPVVVSWALQETTRAAIDRTLAMGANVAAMRGIAVEANHQSLSRASVFKLSTSVVVKHLRRILIIHSSQGEVA
jgi:hypothetical protein